MRNSTANRGAGPSWQAKWVLHNMNNCVLKKGKRLTSSRGCSSEVSRCCFKTTLKALAFLIRWASADDINKSDPLLEHNRKRYWAMINIYGRWIWSIFQIQINKSTRVEPSILLSWDKLEVKLAGSDCTIQRNMLVNITMISDAPVRLIGWPSDCSE